MLTIYKNDVYEKIPKMNSSMGIEKVETMKNRKLRLQHLLEVQAVRFNEGMCETYRYCEFCAEKERLVKQSNTPCADAYVLFKQAEAEKMHLKEEPLRSIEEEQATVGLPEEPAVKTA